MTHREKVERLITDLGGRGVGRSEVAPPLFRLLWRLGIEVPPPLFMGFLPITLIFSPLFGLGWGVTVGLVTWARVGAVDMEWLVPFSIGTGLLFGLAMAGYFRWKADKMRLPPWEDYP
jgi:Family of unknown function (DUF6404)